ncbi:dihydropteroate synthase [Streptococcus infantarius subsp. infantarius]|uniref:dihydropteroate synthase n=1 Tax=Streptococcus infantarius TaxID=102684 RepID=UPI00024DD1D2|nr:dihydropteroate synthase [Streptococcus infantarius]AEZ62387.1 dihydropteroate synthase [Streptococcus infantarius subsp. infantarius CJ18]MCO4480375.1 dihydropteroate synthase [Streptococcus infantarius subsp. infantarius]MCO4482136.1 dihydropteroate synthase [Streptococcus infantarius subsp. infantarius]MCO4487325.1 dihydropteroate synthase [Streptococcus infantarius subsp. infantarius]MCO4498867.1 dihydropteroate synthase [Streptococcus infantarius subsp. infantarius]
MKIGKHNIDGKACIMGVLNVTPDSFSDGGSYTSVEKALEQAEKMIAEGAKIIDVGGESTRPGYTFVEATDEINRVVPVIKVLKEKFDVLVSIDTYKTETARAALEAGADILNDVWAGLYDGEMLALAAEKNVPIILMHNQKEEKYDNITKEVCDFLAERAQAALDAGIAKENIWIDPGFGFAKNEAQNIELLQGLDAVCQLGYPVLFGISRKRTVDYLLGGGTAALERDMGTAALSAWAIAKGCQIVRVHNVDLNRDIVKVISQLV